jgi:hypothetical protein
MDNYNYVAQECCIEVPQVFSSGCEKMPTFTTQAKTYPISMSVTDLNVYMPLRRHVSFLPNPQCILPKHQRFVPKLHNHSRIKHHPTFHLRPAPQNSNVVIWRIDRCLLEAP